MRAVAPLPKADPADHPRVVPLLIGAILAYQTEQDAGAPAGSGPAHELLMQAAATIHLTRLRGRP